MDQKELFADIRNKLQTTKTVLEVLSSGKVPSKRLIELALKNIDYIDKAISVSETKVKV